MDNTKITTCEKNPIFLTQRVVYLTLIAEEIRSYGVGYHVGDINLPSDLAVDYLKFNHTYWDIFETCLRNFDGKSLSDMNNDYKNEIIDIYTNQTEKAIQDAIDYINDNVASKTKKLSIKWKENIHISSKIQKLLERRAVRKIEKDGSSENVKVKEVTIKLRKLCPSTLDSLEGRIRAIAKSSLMAGALDHAISRARLDIPPKSNKEEKDNETKKYHFKKFKHSIADIFKDLLYSSSNEEVKKSLLNKKNAQIINKAVNDYEIIDNPVYLHNQRKFKKAVGQYFRPELKKIRESGANS
jgi:hypothetical protein